MIDSENDLFFEYNRWIADKNVCPLTKNFKMAYPIEFFNGLIGKYQIIDGVVNFTGYERKK
jgi:hypothetical protein